MRKLIEWNIYTPEAAQFVHDYALLTASSNKFKKYNNQTIYNKRILWKKKSEIPIT